MSEEKPMTVGEKMQITPVERLKQIEVLIKDSYNHIDYLKDIYSVNVSLDFIEERLSLAVDEIGRLLYQIS